MNTSDLYTRKEDCTGCGLCSFICPVNIIEMKMDEEGFYYPVILNNSKCLNCQACIHSCPVKTSTKRQSDFIGYYAGFLTDRDNLKESSSGGLAAWIAQCFIESGGVVYGVSYSDDWHKAVYKRAENKHETACFRSSKYIQAEKGELYRNINSDLKNCKKVCVFGVPCDIAAIKGRFGDHESLYTVEIICHGPTSQMIFDSYCSRLENKAGAKMVYFSCRHKKDGKWKPYYNYAKFENGIEFKEPFSSSDYGIAFQCFKRPSCNHCVFKDAFLRGDLMLGDYHYAMPGMPSYNDGGVSVILPHNGKGKSLIPFDSPKVSIVEVSPKSALMNRAIHESISARSSRPLFYKTWKNKGLHNACNMKILSVERTMIKGKNKCVAVWKKLKSLHK